MMRALHEEHPGYGWFTNKGYGTEEHLEALNRLGPWPAPSQKFCTGLPDIVSCES